MKDCGKCSNSLVLWVLDFVCKFAVCYIFVTQEYYISICLHKSSFCGIRIFLFVSSNVPNDAIDVVVRKYT